MQAPFDVELLENQRVLWLTVVEQAMRDTMEPKPSVRQSAIDWLMRDQTDFPQICELAGLDGGYLRNLMASRLCPSSRPCDSLPSLGEPRLPPATPS